MPVSGSPGVIQQMVKQLDLADRINRNCPIFKIPLPYSEVDHVLDTAYNLLAGGTCLAHLELRRKDEAHLNALGAKRIPDPTTAGDFCRRFSTWDVVAPAMGRSACEARVTKFRCFRLETPKSKRRRWRTDCAGSELQYRMSNVGEAAGFLDQFCPSQLKWENVRLITELF